MEASHTINNIDSALAHTLQPLLEQESLLESFVEEAQAQRKFEDVKTLKVNLAEIRHEIERVLDTDKPHWYCALQVYTPLKLCILLPMNTNTFRPSRRLVWEHMAHIYINIGTAFNLVSRRQISWTTDIQLFSWWWVDLLHTFD